MRPKFILTILCITLAFLLLLLISPGLWHRKAVDGAAAAQIKNPTPENIRAVELEQQKARHDQYIVCWLAVANVVVIIVYGALHDRKRLA